MWESGRSRVRTPLANNQKCAAGEMAGIVTAGRAFGGVRLATGKIEAMSQDPYAQQPSYPDPNQPPQQYFDPNQQAYPASAQSANYAGQQPAAGYDPAQYGQQQQQYPQSAQSASYPSAAQTAQYGQQPQYAAAPKPSAPSAFTYIFKPDFSQSGIAKVAPFVQLGTLVGSGLWYVGTVASYFNSAFGFGYGTGVNGFHITVAILFLLVGWLFPLVVTGLVRAFLEFAIAVIETNAARKEKESTES
jgi:type II secretory pathway pseudopilin PulG